ncbi:hypothetical protein B0H12DRAFT_1083217, partial [Mycena haematopus]
MARMTTPSRGHCGQCPPNICVGYLLLSGSSCLCGHGEVVHALVQAVIPPPTAYEILTGSIHRRPSCLAIQDTLRVSVLAADRLNVLSESQAAMDPPPTSSSALAVVPSQTTTHLIWGPADPAQTTEARRRTSAIHNRQWAPGVGGSMPRGLHCSYTTTRTGVGSQSIKPSVKPR